MTAKSLGEPNHDLGLLAALTLVRDGFLVVTAPDQGWSWKLCA